MNTVETYSRTWSDWSSLNGFRTIDYCDSRGGYEWDEFHVLRGPDGRLYIGVGSGCSCNDFGETSPADLVPVEGWQDAVKRLRQWASEDSWRSEGRKAVAIELESRLATTRPRKRITLPSDWWKS